MADEETTAVRRRERLQAARRILRPGRGEFAKKVLAFAAGPEAGFARACLKATPAAADYAVWADWREERDQPSPYWRAIGLGVPAPVGCGVLPQRSEVRFSLARVVSRSGDGGDRGTECALWLRNPAGRMFRWSTRSRGAACLAAGDLVVFSAAWKGESAIEIVVATVGQPVTQAPVYDELVINIGRVQFVCLDDAFAVLDEGAPRKAAAR